MTTLLIESYSLLSQDPGDASVFYLMQISQQLAAGQGIPLSNATLSPSTPSPSFQAPAPVVRVNVLWALSLIVSLACALGATLIQTWTNRYVRLVSKFANVSHRAQQRQFYFEGIKQSRLVVVAEALPALLHLALFLFLAGLIDFFFQVNLNVAYACLCATIVVASLYALLTIAPHYFASIPYQTPLTIHLPRGLQKLIRRYIREYKTRYFPQRVSSHIKAVGTDFVLRQSRALQWLLDRMTGAYSFDNFVEGIEPFLEATDYSTRIVFQLNVGADPEEQRRCLSAHIGIRLLACLEPSIDVDSRRSQVKAMAGALWSLLVRIQSENMDDTISPGGIDDPDDPHLVSQHLKQWLHPFTLRALRRLRHDSDSVISLYATCTLVVILVHVTRSFCQQLQGGAVAVPPDWTFIQLLTACDSPSVHPGVRTSFEFDVLTICLLSPPFDEVGEKSRAEEELEERETSRVADTAQMVTYPGRDLVQIPKEIVRNTCHLAALILLLQYLLSKTSRLQPTASTIDVIQRTVKLLVANTSAAGTDEEMQRSFVGILERLYYPHEVPFHRLLGGKATFVLEDIKRLVASTSDTVDHPQWGPRAAGIVYGVARQLKAEELVFSDVQSGRLGRLDFDSGYLRSSANYIVCCDGRKNALDLSGGDGTSALIFNLHGEDNQKVRTNTHHL